MYRLEGAYSLVLMSAAKLPAARDPQGFRPPVLRSPGRRDLGNVLDGYRAVLTRIKG